MHLSRREIMAGAGGVGLFWPLGACATQQAHHRLYPHGVNLPNPDPMSGYFIDGCQMARPWVGAGPLDANGGLAGTTKDEMARIVGLLGTAEATSYDVVTENVAAFYTPGGGIIPGRAAPGPIRIASPAPTSRIVIKDRQTAQFTIWPTGKGPVKFHVIPTQWRKRWDAGERLSPDLIKRLDGFSSIRAMEALKTNGSTVTDARPLPTADNYSGGMPVEILADIANAARTDLVLNVPHLIDDDLLIDWIAAAHKRLDPGLKLLLEPSNEVWNTAFAQARWAKMQGAGGAMATSDPNAAKKYYGIMAGRIGLAIRKIVGDRPSRVKIFLGWKFVDAAAWPTIIDGYKSTGASIALIDCISAAVYPQFGGPDREKWVQWAQAGDQASANALLDAWVVARSPMFARHAAFATSIGVAFDLYECSVGQLTSQAPVVRDAAIRPIVTDFNMALTHSAAGAARYARLFDMFVSVGGRTAYYYTLVGAGSQYGVYGLYADMQDEVGYPAAAFVRERNAAARQGQAGKG